jgi:excisionase family DNA binding protein
VTGAKGTGVRYQLLNGEGFDLSGLPREDMEFLFALMRRAMEDEDYFSLERAVCGSGAYPLKGGARVTREIHDSLLFQVAEDIADRAGIRQGILAPDPGDERVPMEDIVSVTEAAKFLGVTRSAVIKAAQVGRIKGKKIGNTWTLLRRSVDGYKVAQHRVEAGRSAHRA